jgi:putative endonuclease
MASERNGTIYVGVTSDLPKRVGQHKEGAVEGFTKDYEVSLLVYYEAHDDVNEAIKREKQLKHWNRVWKLELIEKANPQWKDLYAEICA